MLGMAWTVETLNETVDAELADLPADMRTTQRTPAGEIDLALQRAKELET
jgi:hypothetical protein